MSRFFCVCGNPCFALGGFDLQAVVGRCRDPERPYVVEEGKMIRNDDSVNIGKDGDEFAWRLSEAGGEGLLGDISVELVND